MDAQERKILYFLFLSAALMAILFFVLFRNMVKHYKRMQYLHRELTQVELATLERERIRIKADLHDEFAPLLAATGTIISNILVADQANLALKEKASRNTNALIEKLQKISFDLVPTTLLNQGLVAAVEELLYNIEETTGTLIFFSPTPVISITTGTARHLYRIISEALHNTIKYAKAEHCNINIEVSGDKLKLNIIDDGIGFKNIQRGNGLNNIALRTELMKGKFYLDSKPGEGTSILIEIPYS